MAALAALYWWARTIARRDPYRRFLKLPVRRKVAFLKALLADTRVPRWVKALPILLVVYLAMPFDLVPDFIPVLGFLDDVALVIITLVVVARFTPSGVVDELLARVNETGSPPEG